jgi:hypothetical protein
MEALTERRLLVQRICEWMRKHDPRFRPDEEFRLRLRLGKEPLSELRRRFEEDLTEERAKQFARVEPPPCALFTVQPTERSAR